MQKYFFRIGKLITEIVSWTIPIFIGAIILGLIKLPTLSSFLLFILSILGAVTVSYFVEFIIGILTFYTVSSWGLQCFKQAIVTFFSGSLVPIVMMPAVLQNISHALPFQSMVSFPVSIYLEKLSYTEIIYGYANQFFWIIVLALISKIIYTVAIKKVTIAGG